MFVTPQGYVNPDTNRIGTIQVIGTARILVVNHIIDNLIRTGDTSDIHIRIIYTIAIHIRPRSTFVDRPVFPICSILINQFLNLGIRHSTLSGAIKFRCVLQNFSGYQRTPVTADAVNMIQHGTGTHAVGLPTDTDLPVYYSTEHITVFIHHTGGTPGENPTGVSVGVNTRTAIIVLPVGPVINI